MVQGVLPGSLPVVSFGDPSTAAVATASLNPSSREFLTRAGESLPDAGRRLASLHSLGVNDPAELDAGQVRQVVAESYGYFRSGNWYRLWFGWLKRLLTGSGAGSYLDGSACHLDLVQWATVPAQGQLPTEAWQRLVAEDREFLRWQLAHANVSVVLVNGASVINGLLAAGLVSDLAEDGLKYQAKDGTGHLRVFCGTSDGVRFLGWNRPLAGALPNPARDALTGWAAAALRGPAGALPSWQAARAPVGLGPDGFIPAGTTVNSTDELEHLLRRWLQPVFTDRCTVSTALACDYPKTTCRRRRVAGCCRIFRRVAGGPRSPALMHADQEPHGPRAGGSAFESLAAGGSRRSARYWQGAPLDSGCAADLYRAAGRWRRLRVRSARQGVGPSARTARRRGCGPGCGRAGKGRPAG
jgi:hypothetical protein